MKLVFEFPRNDFLELKEVNEFLSTANLSNLSTRCFGVYLKSAPSNDKVNSSSNHFLEFKFFDSDGIEVKPLTFSYELNLDESTNDVALRAIERDVCILSYIAALDLQKVEFTSCENLLSVMVKLDDFYANRINNHKELIFPEVMNNR